MRILESSFTKLLIFIFGFESTINKSKEDFVNEIKGARDEIDKIKGDISQIKVELLNSVTHTLFTPHFETAREHG